MTPDPLARRLARLPEGWQDSPAARVEACRGDVLMFAAVYLRHHIREVTGVVSFSPVHLDWYRRIEALESQEPSRDIYIAPRSMGKTTTFFLLAPLYAAAYRHSKFCAAFSDSATQAEGHLRTFRHELDVNTRLLNDFEHLKPVTRGFANRVDNTSMLSTRGGFAFAARGISSGNLGMKVGATRPDLIVMDDIERGAENYSAYQAEQRLATVRDVVLPLNDRARVVFVGTTTMTGSLIDQAVKHPVAPAKWIDEEGFQVNHALPFDAAGESIWPERWSTDYLRSIEGSSSFALNFLNEPRLLDGEYWRADDYLYGDLASVSRRIIAVDPAVTTSKRSDETGVAVVGYSAAARKAVVQECFGVRLKGEPLRRRIMELLGRYPDVAEVLWERNAGGDMMVGSVLHDLPIPVRTVHNSERKEVRVERALSYYRRGAVMHAAKLPALEAQQQEFPRGLHDDLCDVVAMALDYLAAPKKQPLRAAVA